MASGKSSHSGAHKGARVDITKANKARRAKKRAKVAASPKTLARREHRQIVALNKRIQKRNKQNKPETVVVEAVVAPVI